MSKYPWKAKVATNATGPKLSLETKYYASNISEQKVGESSFYYLQSKLTWRRQLK